MFWYDSRVKGENCLCLTNMKLEYYEVIKYMVIYSNTEPIIQKIQNMTTMSWYSLTYNWNIWVLLLFFGWFFAYIDPIDVVQRDVDFTPLLYNIHVVFPTIDHCVIVQREVALKMTDSQAAIKKIFLIT